ncbi:MAG: hypothetical protein Pg6C_11650 [Treponemataceae bacterium]|jgi:hypothetical protein|nr:MAG: hypothetical protein Pg6C_11650 [Treponemataceae bacterium]
METELPAKTVGASVDILHNILSRYGAHTNAVLKK